MQLRSQELSIQPFRAAQPGHVVREGEWFGGTHPRRLPDQRRAVGVVEEKTAQRDAPVRVIKDVASIKGVQHSVTSDVHRAEMKDSLTITVVFTAGESWLNL